MNEKDRVRSFYLKWIKIDSITKSINSYLHDSSYAESNFEMLKHNMQEIDELLSVFYDYITPTTYQNELENKLKARMSFPTEKEVKISPFPKKIVAFKLLNNLEILTDELMRNISIWDYEYGRYLDTLNVRIRY